MKFGSVKNKAGEFVDANLKSVTAAAEAALSDIPDDLRYSTDHEWARAQGARVRVGITDYAQEHLGSVVHVDFPTVGAAISFGEPCAECGGEMTRVFTPAGIVFKGSGFYQTDYRSESYKKRAEADKPNSEPAASTRASRNPPGCLGNIRPSAPGFAG